MHEKGLRALLSALTAGELALDDAVHALVTGELAQGDTPFASVDTSRALRTGLPEVIFGEGKSAEQISRIMAHLAAHGQSALATRCDADKAEAVLREHPQARYHALARVLELRMQPWTDKGRGELLVVCAGTSDLPVAEEAAVCAEAFGNRVRRIADVGVAGLHRILAHAEALREAQVVIVVAGMEGALPSVVAGLTDRPVLAVPTSVGYGAAFGGVAALLGMLNACASGISVVNIDNGFGAAVQATRINRLP
ncbi:MAG: nickel pincer cofactor biosynthesis protein LarB [Alphaproteobacteria bacterium]|nr:nickel pincer cofactor biosynthesis protein LarB [Alphaproteobacteria bacterium]MCB9792935.1 nickel pincer cofactor biosynthesis protein LarB [Alphaproteobacteria bacterium]